MVDYKSFLKTTLCKKLRYAAEILFNRRIKSKQLYLFKISRLFSIFANFMLDVLKAILVGICASAPLGPVCMLVLQKTLNYGRNAGFVTGLGSSLADTLFASVAVLAVAAVQEFIEVNSGLIMLIGGLIVIVVGISMAIRKSMEGRARVNKVSARFPLQAFLLALSNPGALALMFALMLIFKIDASCDKLLTILGVAIGSTLWWMLLTVLSDRLGRKLNFETLIKINRIVGALVIAFGVWMTAKGIITVL